MPTVEHGFDFRFLTHSIARAVLLPKSPTIGSQHLCVKLFGLRWLKTPSCFRKLSHFSPQFSTATKIF